MGFLSIAPRAGSTNKAAYLWSLATSISPKQYLMTVPPMFESILLEPLIDRDELARRLGVTPSCIRKWQEKRSIPFYKFGRRCVRFDYREVLTVLSKYRQTNHRRIRPRRFRSGNAPPRMKQAEFSFADLRQPDLLGLSFDK
jgi:excisionase family DNA binding protein